jgi:8-amino-7-oxononanoate synthase
MGLLSSLIKTKISNVVGKKDPNKSIRDLLSFLKDNKLYPAFPSVDLDANEPYTIMEGKKYDMFCSNNYLSLSKDPEIVDAFIAGAKKYGLGPGGSRVINGNYKVIQELEAKIAKLVNKEACLIVPTGYMANVAVVRSLMDPLMLGLPNNASDSLIISDEYNHGSMIDGCKLSKAKVEVYKHNNLEDLEKILSTHSGYSNKVVFTEGVFSTEGEITDIQKIVEISKKYNARVFVDEAHAIGVLGQNGGGSCVKFGVSSDVEVIMGSLDKAFGALGGFLCGSKELIDYLNIAMRSSILSSSYPAAFAQAMCVAVDKVASAEDRRKRILDLSEKLRLGLKGVGFEILGEGLPAVPVMIGEEELAVKFYNKLMERGIFTNIFRWPAVPEKKSRLRLTIMNDHSDKQIDKLIDAMTSVGKELKLIK